ncbi:MAG: hypothetical protein K2W95_19120 [Candidatus Obscuribacterales bacterium]|nr:hypothetical protein [Candidatus Obscuribacterales bacterium]
MLFPRKLGLNVRAALEKELGFSTSLQDPPPDMMAAYPNSLKRYVNDATSQLLITDDSIILFRPDGTVTVRFDQLVDVEVLPIQAQPDWKKILISQRESRIIALKQKSGQVAHLPVLNETNNCLEILSMRAFLKKVLFFENKRR